MDSLNSQIWTDEDENIADITGNVLIYVMCLISCETQPSTNCGGSSPPYGASNNMIETCIGC